MALNKKHKQTFIPQIVSAWETGFTLVEIMIAMLVLSVGIFALASMQVSAVTLNSSASQMTSTVNLAQSRLDEILALRNTQNFTDLNLIDDDEIKGNLEPFTDSDGIAGYSEGDQFTDWNGNGIRDNAEGEELYHDSNANGIRDLGETFTDSNGNGIWDAAHVDPAPPPGYCITWSVIDNRPVAFTKFIRIYVTRLDQKKTILFSCVKPQEG